MIRAVGSTVGGAGSTLLAVGAATIVLSNTVIGVGRLINKRQRMKHAIACGACQGQGLVICSVCRGNKVLDDWSPFPEPQTVERPCLCPTCCGAAESKCVNCLGEGIVY